MMKRAKQSNAILQLVGVNDRFRHVELIDAKIDKRTILKFGDLFVHVKTGKNRTKPNIDGECDKQWNNVRERVWFRNNYFKCIGYGHISTERGTSGVIPNTWCVMIQGKLHNRKYVLFYHQASLYISEMEEGF